MDNEVVDPSLDNRARTEVTRLETDLHRGREQHEITDDELVLNPTPGGTCPRRTHRLHIHPTAEIIADLDDEDVRSGRGSG